MIYHTTVVVFFCFLSDFGSAFPPQSIDGSGPSHRNITVDGIKRAAGIFLKRYNLVEDRGQTFQETIQDFFGSDTAAEKGFIDAIDAIVKFVNEVQLTRASEAFIHVNGEQINLAQSYLNGIRHSIYVEANSSNPDVTLIRQLIGRSLYTIQAFYSNTNWVEMNGAAISKDFGLGGTSVLPVAGSLQRTCKNCDPLGFGDPSCEDNIIVDDILTSGYRSGQDILKPDLNSIIIIVEGVTQRITDPNADQGKCSHGGETDESRFEVATGGINKETLNEQMSPHFMLTEVSAAAATAATEAYLVDEAMGLDEILGQELYQEVFNLTTRAMQANMSLAFAIDVSGSMSDDIEAVRDQTVNLVTSMQGSDNAPANYVLATFNDPVGLTTGRQTKDGFEMINWLNALVATGGGDCPEFAMSGILRGIELSLPGSTLYVFSDADAKDEDREAEVIAAATAKNIKCEFLLTGTCSRRRKRDISIKKRNTDPFAAIATSTGGSLTVTTKDELPQIIENVIEENLPSSTVNIESFRLPTSSTTDIPLSVDNTITLYKVEIIGTASADNVNLVYQDGSEITNANGVSISKLQLTMRTIYSIVNPQPGTLRLIKVSNGNWDVVITAQSSMDVNIGIQERELDGYTYPINGNPIQNREYFLVATMTNLSENSTIDTINVFDGAGNIEKIGNITAIPQESRYVVKYVFVNTVMAFQVEGVDDKGNNFKRTVFQTVPPVNGRLFLESINQVSVDVPANITYKVENTGGTAQTFVLSFSDNKGFIPASQQIRTLSVNAMSSVMGVIEIMPSSGPTVLTYNAALRLQFSDVILQAQTRVAQVTTIKRPVCSVSNITGSCPPESQTPTTCALYDWTGLAVIQFEGVMLSSVYLTNEGETTTLTTDDIATMDSNITASVGGDCCTTLVNLIAVDTDGFFTRCTFRLSENSTRFVFIPPVSTTPSPTTMTVSQAPESSQGFSMTVMYGIIGGGALLLLIIIAIVIAIVCIKRKPKKDDVYPLT